MWRRRLRRLTRDEARECSPDTVSDMDEPWPWFGERRPGVEHRDRPGGYAIARRDDGSIALVETASGVYLPGGGQEGDETPEEATLREVHEECGLVVELTGLVGRADQYVHADHVGVHLRKRCTFFTARILRDDGHRERGHTLLFASPERAVELLVHASQRWAVGRAALGAWYPAP